MPIVAGAALFDLGVVTDKVRPGPDDGYAACQAASTGRVDEGSVGAGTGATVGKVLGPERAVKGGIGTAGVDLGHGLAVGAIVAVNALGGVVDPDTGAIIAGPRREDGVMLDSMELITSPGYDESRRPAPSNTTIGVVATNARLTKEQANKLASVAHDGLAMAIRPAHTMRDGDTIFALATGALDRQVDLDRVLAASVTCMSSAIVRGVKKATGLGGIPAVKELNESAST